MPQFIKYHLYKKTFTLGSWFQRMRVHHSGEVWQQQEEGSGELPSTAPIINSKHEAERRESNLDMEQDGKFSKATPNDTPPPPTPYFLNLPG